MCKSCKSRFCEIHVFQEYRASRVNVYKRLLNDNKDKMASNNSHVEKWILFKSGSEC